ncbi:hypothetical protein VMCG_03231 [Cytospora schulzeri]|uniref:Uncharacterized protein n=1 Tax=Cytospora schulzeri TaxID=448051 RepID=A0A423WYC6_9PEZI|nr:hypothetical protein VMCG_03231 [Valsa malicola]
MPDIHGSIITIIITPIRIFVIPTPVPITISINSDVRLLSPAQSPLSTFPQGLAIHLCFMLYLTVLAIEVPQLLLSLADALEATTEAAPSGGFWAPVR